MKTKIYGEGSGTVVIEVPGKKPTEIHAADSIFKFWFSDGTVFGIKYGKYSKLYPNIWHITILNKGTASFAYKQCFKETLLYNSDVYEIDAELTRYEVMPKSYYTGDDIV